MSQDSAAAALDGLVERANWLNDEVVRLRTGLLQIGSPAALAVVDASLLRSLERRASPIPPQGQDQ